MAQHEKFYLNGTWQLKKADETLLCPVEIPGSVLSGLTEHGLLCLLYTSPSPRD